MPRTKLTYAIAAVWLFFATLAMPSQSTAGEIQLVGMVEARDYLVMDPPSNFQTIASQSGILVVEQYTMESLGITVAHVRYLGDLSTALADYPNLVIDDYVEEGYELVFE